MRLPGISLRIVLLGLLLAAAGYALWFVTLRRAIVPTAEMRLLTVIDRLEPGRAAEDFEKLPEFDPPTETWRVNGKLTRSIAALVHDYGYSIDAPRYVMRVRLPHGSRMPVMQRALFALAREGLCDVAIYPDATSSVLGPLDGPPATQTYRIERVPDGRGGAITCRNRFDRKPS